MRKLILFLLVFASAKVSAQVYQEMPQYGYRANRMAFDSTLQIPTVCGAPTLKSVVKTNKSGAIAYDSCNAIFYTYNPKTQTWSAVTGGGGGSTDTTSLSNRINLKIDSLKRSNDSVYAYKNGTRFFQFKDSVGSGDFLPLSGGTLTGNLNGTTATFSSNGSSNTFNINHTSGSGHALEITKGGNGEGIIVNKTSGSGNAVTITGTLNATTLVKNGGTSSQFLKADGSVDATTYVSDTSALQRKSLSANTIMANNTSGTANATAQVFKQFGNQTYSDSITFTGVTNPSGAFNHTFRYSQIGNLVTLHITLTYATAGSLSQVAIEIPDGLPIPILPNGLTANNDIIAYGSGFMTSSTTAVAIVFSKVFLRQNTGLVNNYEIVINQASNSTYRIFNATIQYFAQ
jgi:hypothetical protein